MTWTTRISDETATVKWSTSNYDTGAFFNGYLGEAIDALNKLLNEIPEEYRARAEIEFESPYESDMITCEISYQRPATQAEIDAKKAELQQFENNRRQQDYQRYLSLKKQFEG